MQNGARLSTLERRCVPKQGGRRTRVWPVARNLRRCLKKCFKPIINKSCDADKWDFVSKSPTMVQCAKQCKAITVPTKVVNKNDNSTTTLDYYQPITPSPSVTPLPSPTVESPQNSSKPGFITIQFSFSKEITTVNLTAIPQINRVCKTPGSDGQMSIWLAAERFRPCVLRCLSGIMGNACDPNDWDNWAKNDPKTDFCLVEKCSAREQQLEVIVRDTGARRFLRFYGI